MNKVIMSGAVLMLVFGISLSASAAPKPGRGYLKGTATPSVSGTVSPTASASVSVSPTASASATPKAINRIDRALCQVDAKSDYLLAKREAAAKYHTALNTAHVGFKAGNSGKAELKAEIRAAHEAFRLADINAKSAFKAAKDACKMVKPTPTPSVSPSASPSVSPSVSPTPTPSAS